MKTRRHFWSEGSAWDVLKERFIVDRGVIRPKKAEHHESLTEEENDALNYLCAEWDYSYIGI